MNKQEMKEKLVRYWTDAMDLDSLVEYYQDKQYEFLDDLADYELVSIFENEFGKDK